MKAIRFIGWMIMEFVAALWLMLIACTVTIALYLLIEIIYWFINSFKHEQDHQQPGNVPVGLQRWVQKRLLGYKYNDNRGREAEPVPVLKSKPLV